MEYYGLAQQITQITSSLSLLVPGFLDGRTGFSSFPLERQSRGLHIPGFSGDLWPPGPSCYAPGKWTGVVTDSVGPKSQAARIPVPTAGPSWSCGLGLEPFLLSASVSPPASSLLVVDPVSSPQVGKIDDALCLQASMAPYCLLDTASGFWGCCGCLLPSPLTFTTCYQASVTCTQHPQPHTGILSSSIWQSIYILPPESGSNVISPSSFTLSPASSPLLCAEPGLAVTSWDRHFFRSPHLPMTEEGRHDSIRLPYPPLLFLALWQ